MEDYIVNKKIGQFIGKKPKLYIDGNYLKKTKNLEKNMQLVGTKSLKRIKLK